MLTGCVLWLSAAVQGRNFSADGASPWKFRLFVDNVSSEGCFSVKPTLATLRDHFQLGNLRLYGVLSRTDEHCHYGGVDTEAALEGVCADDEGVYRLRLKEHGRSPGTSPVKETQRPTGVSCQGVPRCARCHAVCTVCHR